MSNGFREKTKKMMVYLAMWFIPSTTPVYIIFREYLGYDMIPSYLIGCIIPAIVAYPFMKYSMK